MSKTLQQSPELAASRAPDWWMDAWRMAYCDEAKARAPVAGLPLHGAKGAARLQTQTNLQSSYLDVEPSVSDADALAKELFADPATAMVSLDYLSEHSRALALLRKVKDFHRLERRHASRALTDTSRPYEEWLAGRPTKRRKRLRALDRGMPGAIAASFTVHARADDALLEAIFALEAKGWKGRGGTAISQNRADLVFYTELARAAEREGALRIITIHDGAQLVAFEYDVLLQGRLLSAKVGYDEEYAALQPGSWLALRTICWACAEPDIRLIDMLGNSAHISENKARFGDLREDLWRVRLYRPGPRGTLLYACHAARQRLTGLKARLRRAR